ncbi:nucleotidyl cyclase domain-containing protein [Lentisalinibacter salinarum]|uniref:hypothetical protein n=1 Tax=Lentisalinibacter salinarum TaxID=2992239 RepID=UPI0038690B5F
MSFPHDLLEDAVRLAEYQGWSEEVYRDFLRLQRGEMSPAEFDEKYHWERAILNMDMTGFTASAIREGELESLLRIFDAQKVCLPVLEEHGAGLVRCFADDIVALFESTDAALDAALEIHRRVELFNASPLASRHPTRCCAGIGFGTVFAIGPNLAQGDEMNKASKLGEDIARAGETLLTERARAALTHRDDVRFEEQDQDDQLFPFYRAVPAGR